MVNLKELQDALIYWNEENAETKILKGVYNLKGYLSLLFNPNHYESLESGEDQERTQEDIDKIYNSISESERNNACLMWNNRVEVKNDTTKYISNQTEQKELVIEAVMWAKEILNQ